LVYRRIKLEFKTAHSHLGEDRHWSKERQVQTNTDIRRGRHVVYSLHAHLVFVTKYRRNALSELAIRDLRGIFAKVCHDFSADLIECNGEDDHVHLLIHYPPTVVLPKLVNSLKGVSSRLLREWRPEVRGRYKRNVLWSPSYFVASCGGAPLSVIADYVRSQRVAPPPRPEGRGSRRGNF
jgi:putative transposase